MPFLTLNGVTIPTMRTAESGGDVERTLYGEETAAYNGAAQIDRRSRKRVWTFKTKPINPVRAAAIVGLLNGDGFYFPYNTDLYATNGLGPSTSTNVFIDGNIAGDGRTILDDYGNAITSPYGQNHFIEVPPQSTTNLFPTTIATCSSTTGFTASGTTTVALDTVAFFDGTVAASVKITQGSSGNVTLTAVTGSFTTNQHYVYSAMVRNTSNQAITLTMTDATHSTTMGTLTVTPTSGYWQHVVFTGVVGASGSSSVVVSMAGASNGHQFNVAAQQLELAQVAMWQPSNGASATMWQNPANGTRAAGVLQYAASLSVAHGYTIAAWVSGIEPTTTNQELLLYTASNSGQAYMSLGYLGTPYKLSFDTRGEDLTLNLLQGTLPGSAPYYGLMVATITPNPPSGGVNKALYWNGSLIASNTSLNFPFTTAMTLHQMGGIAGRFGQVQVLPYAVDQNWVTAMYNNAGVQWTTPFLTMSGDCITARSVNVYGKIKKETFIGFKDPTYGWVSHGRQLEFILTEA